MHTDNENSENQNTPFQMPLKLFTHITLFLDSKSLGMASLASKQWRRAFTDLSLWQRRLIQKFKVKPSVLEFLHQHPFEDAEYRYYRSLHCIVNNEGLDGSDLKRDILSAIDPDETDLSLSAVCLLDDVTLLKKIPIEDLFLWFAVSCFAQCVNLPSAILEILPISLPTFIDVVALSGNFEVMKLTAPKISFERMCHSEENKFRSQILKNAIRSRSLQVVKFLLEEQSGIRFPVSPLNIGYSCQTRDIRILELVLSKISIDDNEIDSILSSYDARGSRSYQMLKYVWNLQKDKADPPLLKRLESNLNEVIRNDDIESYDFLLQLGAKPNIETLYAAMSSNSSVFLTLLQDPNNNFAEEIDQLEPEKKDDLMGEAAKLGKLKILLQYTTSLQPTTDLLDWAARGSLETIKYLIEECNMKPDQATLGSAVEKGDHQIIDYLLQPNFNLNITADHHTWPAARSNKLSIVKFIFNHIQVFPSYLIDHFTRSTLTSFKYIFEKYNSSLKNTKLPRASNGMNRVMQLYLFHPNHAFTRPVFYDGNPLSEWYRIFHTHNVRAQDLKDAIIWARNNDPEFFYSTFEYYVQNNRLEPVFSFEVFSFDVIQESTYPTTQYAIAKAAIEGNVVLGIDLQESLLRKAIRGFDLLGKHDDQKLAVTTLEKLLDANERQNYVSVSR